MREYYGGKQYNGYRVTEKTKHRALGPVRVFLVGCCAVTVMITAMVFILNGFPLSFAGESGGVRLLTGGDGNTADLSGQTSGENAAWYLLLVNQGNHMPEGYRVELTQLENGEQVDKRIYPALQKMFDAARGSGVYPVVTSGYRTAAEQKRLLQEKTAAYRKEGYSAKEATTKAKAWVAAPGTSEHQLGIAVDINADGGYSTDAQVYKWLDQNAHKYGFVYRYPADKTDITGVIGEPWHYRYVGVEAATKMYKRGICLEEYLGQTG